MSSGLYHGPADGLSPAHVAGIVRFKGIVETLSIGATTPIDEQHCHLRFNFSIKKLGGADTTRGAGPIAPYRRWAGQFHV